MKLQLFPPGSLRVEPHLSEFGNLRCGSEGKVLEEEKEKEGGVIEEGEREREEGEGKGWRREWASREVRKITEMHLIGI